MDANQIIDGIKSITERYYEPSDSMRYPFQVGCLETKLREIVYIYNNTAEEVRRLQRELAQKED